MKEILRGKKASDDFNFKNLFEVFKNHRRKFITIGSISLIGCITLSLAVRAYNDKKQVSSFTPESTRMIASVPPSSTPTVSKATPQSKGLEVELITMTPNGFEPKEIVRPSGKFLIVIENRSGLKELSLGIDSASNNRLFSGRIPKEKLLLQQTADYQPGIYTLTEIDHPQWVCHITITQ